MSNTQEVLQQVLPEVFENLAFLFADPGDEDEAPAPGTDYLRAHMGFAGMMKGSLSLVVPAEMSGEIAANMLGLDPDDEDAAEGARDALKEVLNVICGHVLTELVGEEPVFDLTVPDVAPFDVADWEEATQEPNTALFSVDENPVLLHMTIEEAQ